MTRILLAGLLVVCAYGDLVIYQYKHDATCIRKSGAHYGLHHPPGGVTT